MSLPNSSSTSEATPNKRMWPKLAFVFATVGTIAAAVLVVEGRRSAEARPGAAPSETARAERAMAAKFIPAPVPDGSNFVATPYFTSLFPKPSRADTNQWPDDFSRADSWPREFPRQADSPIGRATGRFVTDLVSWQKVFELSQSGASTNEQVTAVESPEPVANARAASVVLKYLKPYEPVLAELHAANKRPLSRFNVDYSVENPWAILLPHLAVVKRTCQLLRLKTEAEVAAAHSQQALEDALLLLRLVDAPRDEPTLISQLVRVACLQISMQPIWEGLAARTWSASQLASLQTQLEKFDFIVDLKHALESERAWGNVTIGIVRDKRVPGLLNSMLDPSAQEESWQKEANRAFQSCPPDWFDQEMTNFNRIFDEHILSIMDFENRRVDPGMAEEKDRLVTSAIGNKRNLVKDHLVFARMLIVAPSKLTLKMVNAQATAEMAALACALERHRLATGEYPETLNALVPRFSRQVPRDAIDGEPLRYQRTSDGLFVLYSIGWNQTDDNGTPAFFASGRGPETKEGDWVWRYAAK